jgi:arylamine N-acetyltransferase
VTALDDSLAAAYLELLGVDARAGEVDASTLAELQRAHVASVPYENIDIVRGSPPAIEPVGCARRIVAGRGGYCFHLNGAFSSLLEWLGVDVTRHLAGVQGRSRAEPPGANGNHLGLTAEIDGVRWLVEAGTGDGPPEPLPLAPGSYEQDGFVFGLRRSPLVTNGWRLDHDPRGAWILFDVAAEPAATGDFAAMHTTLSTDPESGFVRIAAVMRRRGASLDILRGCVFSQRDKAGERVGDVDSCDEWWAIVIDEFRLAYGDVTARERLDLWRTVRATHEAWDADGRP